MSPTLFIRHGYGFQCARQLSEKAFCAANSLTLNASKTEAVMFSREPFTPYTIEVDSSHIQTQSHSKCLGVWWQHDLSPSKSVKENISKARHAFFALSSVGSFQGKLNPLYICL